MTDRDYRDDAALLSWREVERMVPYSRQHACRLERDGKFPPRIQCGPGRVAWRLGDLRAWLASRTQGALPAGRGRPDRPAA